MHGYKYGYHQSLKTNPEYLLKTCKLGNQTNILLKLKNLRTAR